MKMRTINAGSLALHVSVCLALAGVSSAQTDYHWLSDSVTGGMDTDWSNAANWGAEGVPADQDATQEGLSGDMVLVFGGTALPDQFPDFAGGASVAELLLGADSGGATQVSPVLDVRSGGRLVVRYLGKKGVVRNNADVDPVLTVGDGIGGGAEDVEVEIRANFFLNRFVAGTLTGLVHSDGVLTVGGALKLSYDSRKHSVLEVNDHMGNVFVSSTGLEILAQDNGDGTFTVSATEPELLVAVVHRSGSGELDLTWESVPGNLYTIEVSESLRDWNPFETDYPAAEPGESTSCPLGMPTEQPKFYRVVLEAP